jgi:hypothetical protein
MKEIEYVYDDKYEKRFSKMMFGIDHRFVFGVGGNLYQYTGVGFHNGSYQVAKLGENKYYKIFDIGCYNSNQPHITKDWLLQQDFKLFSGHEKATKEDIESYEMLQSILKKHKK